MIGPLLDAWMVVYTADATHAYTTVAVDGLPCRLSSTGSLPSGFDPTTGQPTKRLYWEAEVAIPHDCQIDVGGVRYQPVHGTESAPTLRGRVAFRQVDVIRAEV